MNEGDFLRMRTSPGGKVICMIDPGAIGPDPAAFGIAPIDAIRHGARAHAQAVGVTEDHALERIWWGFDAERNTATDDPRQIS